MAVDRTAIAVEGITEFGENSLDDGITNNPANVITSVAESTIALIMQVNTTTTRMMMRLVSGLRLAPPEGSNTFDEIGMMICGVLLLRSGSLAGRNSAGTNTLLPQYSHLTVAVSGTGRFAPQVGQ